MTRWLFGLLAWPAVLCAFPAMAQTQREACPPVAGYSSELFANATERARNRGLLWRIQRDGHASYLYDTLHVGKAEWMSPGLQMRNALRAADTVA